MISQVALEIGDVGDAQTAAGYNNGKASSFIWARRTQFSRPYHRGRQWGNGGLFFNCFANSQRISGECIRRSAWNIGDGVNTLAAEEDQAPMILRRPLTPW
jgi:hypothetical protein